MTCDFQPKDRKAIVVRMYNIQAELTELNEELRKLQETLNDKDPIDSFPTDLPTHPDCEYR